MSSSPPLPPLGARLSFSGSGCTVRFAGRLPNTSGFWIGVEWDDPTRGKHDGEHLGVRYFHCSSPSPTAGSFLRPSRQSDPGRSLIEAIQWKYINQPELPDQVDHPDAATSNSTLPALPDVSFHGFSRARARHSKLTDFRRLVLDGCSISHTSAADLLEIRTGQLDGVKEVNLARNLFTRWSDIVLACGAMKSVVELVVDGNRFSDLDAHKPDGAEISPQDSADGSPQDAADSSRLFSALRLLSLDRTWASWSEYACVLAPFTGLDEVSLMENGLAGIPPSITVSPSMQSIRILRLGGNALTSLDQIKHLAALSRLESIDLSSNKIRTIYATDPPRPFSFPPSVTEINLAHNQLSDWSAVHHLPRMFPSVRRVRMNGNGLPGSEDDVFFGLVGRFGLADLVNLSVVGPHERLEGDRIYWRYLDDQRRLGTDISTCPRLSELDSRFNPEIDDGTAKSSSFFEPPAFTSSLGLVKIQVHLHDRTDTIWVPKDVTAAVLAGVVGSRFKVDPMVLLADSPSSETAPTAGQVEDEDGLNLDSDSDDGPSLSADFNKQLTGPVRLALSARPAQALIPGMATGRGQVRVSVGNT